MKVLYRPFFIICMILFALHQLLQWGLKIHLPLADAYLDNLLVMPIVLHLWLAERRSLFRSGNRYELSIEQIIAATVYILLITEWLFPLLTSRFTGDLWDIAFTVAGAAIFYWASRRNESANQPMQD